MGFAVEIVEYLISLFSGNERRQKAVYEKSFGCAGAIGLEWNQKIATCFLCPRFECCVQLVFVRDYLVQLVDAFCENFTFGFVHRYNGRSFVALCIRV